MVNVINFLKDLEFVEKILCIMTVIMLLIFSIAGYNRSIITSKANIEIETPDKIYYTLKETLMISPDNGCIDFYDLVKEYNTKHCGQYTVRYLKDTK